MAGNGKTKPIVENWTQKVLNDPHGMRARLLKESSRMLEKMEQTPLDDIEIRVWYMALMSMWRAEAVGVALRKEKFDEPDRGSAVRKYAGAFAQQANGSGGGKAVAREPEPEPEPDFDLDSILNDDDDNAVA